MLRLLTLLTFCSTLALAQTNPPSFEARQIEAASAWRAAHESATEGPATIPLRDQATLRLPGQMAFVPEAPAARVSRALGNTPGPALVGMVISLEPKNDWLVVIRWEPEGFVKDDDAADLKPDSILESLREGTAEANKDRATRGFPELELTSWTQEPAYDKATHQLSWALGAKAKGDQDDEASINFNTRALGRNGYFSLNLISDVESSDNNRSVAARLLNNLDFNKGAGYGDFNVGTDKVAEYGLVALLGVVAAKKLGLIALAGVFVLKFAKIGLLALAGVGLAIRRFFRRPA